MSLSDCKIDWDAPAILHERVWTPPAPAPSQLGHGGPVVHGSFAGMVRRALAAEAAKQEDMSITVDAYVVGGKTWLEIDDIREVSKRPDFPAA